MLQADLQHLSNCSDEGLLLEKSGLKSLYAGQSTLSKFADEGLTLETSALESLYLHTFICPQTFSFLRNEQFSERETVKFDEQPMSRENFRTCFRANFKIRV